LLADVDPLLPFSGFHEMVDFQNETLDHQRMTVPQGVGRPARRTKRSDRPDLRGIQTLQIQQDQLHCIGYPFAGTF
jgi:hypothetical protein